MRLSTRRRRYIRLAGSSRRTALAAVALATLLVALLAAAPCIGEETAQAPAQATTEGPATTVFLVRHAEKLPSGEDRDPALTRAGKIRALQVAHALGAARIDAIYATPWKRTRLTAQPLAEELGLEVQIVDTNETYAARMAEILRQHSGKRIVVVSHSNTIPEIISALGIDGPKEIDESDYDNLFIATLHADGGDGGSLIHLRFGRETL